MTTHGINIRGSLLSRTAVALLAAVFMCIPMSGLIGIDTGRAMDLEKTKTLGHPRYCSATAQAAYKACGKETEDDYWIAMGNCLNLSSPEERKVCSKQAKYEKIYARQLCKDQREARLDVCDGLGEAPYDPDIVPAEFIDFEEVLEGDGEFIANPYFPLVPGTTWIYKVKDAEGVVIEKIKVQVLDETKTILGVNCIVVRDRVWEIDEEGEKSIIEDTHDWYAQDTFGNVWYFGEIAMDYEDGELVGIDGSWTSGVDGAKPGILVWAEPDPANKAHRMYRQEFFLGDAEDMGGVVGIGEVSVTVPYGTFTEDVLVTRDFSPIAPDVLEFKYYAPGVGTILEENPADGERLELVRTIPSELGK